MIKKISNLILQFCNDKAKIYPIIRNLLQISLIFVFIYLFYFKLLSEKLCIIDILFLIKGKLSYVRDRKVVQCDQRLWLYCSR